MKQLLNIIKAIVKNFESEEDFYISEERDQLVSWFSDHETNCGDERKLISEIQETPGLKKLKIHNGFIGIPLKGGESLEVSIGNFGSQECYEEWDDDKYYDGEDIVPLY